MVIINCEKQKPSVRGDGRRLYDQFMRFVYHLRGYLYFQLPSDDVKHKDVTQITIGNYFGACCVCLSDPKKKKKKKTATKNGISKYLQLILCLKISWTLLKKGAIR